MILCTSQGMWFYSTGMNRIKRICWVRCGPNMPHPDGFEPLPPVGALLDGPLAWPGDIRFFPEIRYRGCRVYPRAWHPTAHEPILKIFADDIDVSKYFKANPQVNTSDLRKALIADGWDWDAREGGVKSVHVDELEKIEGPPPEGPF